MDPLISEGVALITGSGSGIGQAIATGFARSGCTKIFLVDLSRDGLEATRKLITNENSDAKVSVHVADVSDDASVKNMVESCVKDFGRIDFACNNAGIAMQDNVTTEVSTETLDRVINVNLKGVGDRRSSLEIRHERKLTRPTDLSLPPPRDPGHDEADSAEGKWFLEAQCMSRIHCQYSFNVGLGSDGRLVSLQRLEAWSRLYDSGRCPAIRQGGHPGQLCMSWVRPDSVGEELRSDSRVDGVGAKPSSHESVGRNQRDCGWCSVPVQQCCVGYNGH